MVAAGWYSDPAGSARLRYWDGTGWTDHYHDPTVQPQGVAPVAPTQVITQQQPYSMTTTPSPTVVYHQQVTSPGTKVARGCAGGFVAVILLLVGIVMVIIIVVFLAIGNAARHASTPGTGSSVHPALADVTISGCAVSANQFMGPEATLTVINHSTKSSNYFITVAFDSMVGNTQLDTG